MLEMEKPFLRYDRSQSPQTGQFNSYSGASGSWHGKMSEVSIPSNGSIQFLRGYPPYKVAEEIKCLNPLKRVNSILTDYAVLNKYVIMKSLNPLKRVNSILTEKRYWFGNEEDLVSIPSNGSIQFLR
mgnify:CR=1 FL=1